MVQHIGVTRRHPARVERSCFACSSSVGVSFSRDPIYRDHPSLVHKVGGGWFAPAKGAKYGVLWAPALCGSMSGKPASASDEVCTMNLINTPLLKLRLKLTTLSIVNFSYLLSFYNPNSIFMYKRPLNSYIIYILTKDIFNI